MSDGRPRARGRTRLWRYNFGLYHWRRRGRRVVTGILAVAVAAFLRGSRRRDSWLWRGVAACLLLWGASEAVGALRSLLDPPPWRVDVEKYRRFAAHLPTEDADRLLDVGCGTGRSLVGLAPAVGGRRGSSAGEARSGGVSVFGLDVFDDRVILGNAPGLARRNAAAAGLDCTVVRGDAASLPFDDGSFDVVTACRVLHDLPAPAAERALAEARRVCGADGSLGVLALPLPHDADADPVDYWRGAVTDAGFDVGTVETFERRGREYIVIVADVRTPPSGD